jgi:hypothetical protein
MAKRSRAQQTQIETLMGAIFDLKPYEDFVWYKGRVWLYEGQPFDRQGRHFISHPFDPSLGVSAYLKDIQKVNRATHEATLKAIAYMYEQATDPRFRGRRHNPSPRRMGEKFSDYVERVERERIHRKRWRRSQRVTKKKGKRRNPRGVDMRIFFNDDDPELVTGIIIIPVSKSAKTWLGWMDELLGLTGVVFARRGRRSVGAYYAPMDKAKWLVTEFRKGWNVVVEDE